MSNVLISMPSELITTKQEYLMENGKFTKKKIERIYLLTSSVPEECIWGWDSSSESFNKFFKNCIQGHMYKNGKIIESKKDLIK
jgi:hypothetical protein